MPIVLSLLVLGAHFLRDDNSLGVIAVALLVLVLFVRRPWAARLVQVTLVLGTSRVGAYALLHDAATHGVRPDRPLAWFLFSLRLSP